MLTTQSELLNLAIQAKETHQYQLARDYLIQAHELGVDPKIISELVAVYFVLHEEDQAYLMIKGLPDLFSDLEIFELYQQILVAEQYFLEQQKLIYLIDASFTGQKLANLKEIISTNLAQPAEPKEQAEIMRWFRGNVSQGFLNTDLFQLYKLSIENFSDLSENYFLDKFHNPRIKVSLISELIMLKVNRNFNYFSLEKIAQFNPINLKLLTQTPEFLEGQQLIIDKLFEDPVKLELIYSNFVEIIQTVYPKITKYIPNLTDFVEVLISYLDDQIPDKSISNVVDYIELIKKILV